MQALKIPKRRNPIQTLGQKRCRRRINASSLSQERRLMIPSLKIVRAQDEITRVAIENSLQCCSLLSKKRDLLNPRTDPIDPIDSKKTDLVNPRTDYYTKKPDLVSP